MLLFLAGCSGDVVLLQSEHQAQVDVHFELDPLPVSAGTEELDVQLEELVVDSLGREMEGAEIVQLQLFVFPDLGPEEVADGLADDSLVQADVGSFLEVDVGQAVPLAEEYEFLPESGTWLLIAADEAGDSRRLGALEPVLDGPAELDWASDAAQIAVDLSWGEPLPWGNRYDWSELTTDVQGRELLHRQLDLLSAARVELSSEELAQRFVELEELAVERVDLELEGQVQASAEELAGFEQGSGWVMGLSCSSCSSPVPRVLVRMEE